MRPTVTMRQALEDDELLGRAMPGESFRAHRVLQIASMGEALTRDERRLFRELTSREREPMERVDELIEVVGRRGGKSRAAAVLLCYLSALCDHSDVLAPGETGVALCIAPDLKQAQIILNYCAAAFEQSPRLASTVVSRTAEALQLRNGIQIETRASSFRRLRGPTYIAVVCDEASYWFDSESGSANTDDEIIEAVRPGLATTGGMLVVVSSPYAKRGVLYEAHRDHYGPAGDSRILVAQGPSRLFNPTLKQSVVDRAMKRDPAKARAEFLAEFRDDLSAFVDRNSIMELVDSGIVERPPVAAIRHSAFVDMSGGRVDSAVLAIGHLDGDIAMLDCLREIPSPHSPDDAVEEFARLLKSYRLREVIGDKFAASWPVDGYARHQIKYLPAAAPKSDLYRDLLPVVNARRVRLLDVPRLVGQLCSLERRTARGGRDSIDHPPGQRDDAANAVAGLVATLLGTMDEKKRRYAAYNAGLARYSDSTGGRFTAVERMLMAQRQLQWWMHL